MAGYRDVRGMMEVVIPDRVQSKSTRLRRSNESRLLGFVLGNHDDGTSAGSASSFTVDASQNMVGRLVEYLLSGIEPKPIEMELANPVDGIADKKFAHRAGIGPVEV